MKYFWVLEERTMSGAPIYLTSKSDVPKEEHYRTLEHVCTSISINRCFHFDSEDEAEDFLSDIITITGIEERFFLMNMKAVQHAIGD